MTKIKSPALAALALILTSILSLCLLPSAYAQDAQTRNGNLLTAGLPLVAAGLSLAGEDTEGFKQLVKSEAATVLIVEALKSGTHQTRPNGRDDKSFPSLQTAVSFSAAQYMQEKGGWQYGLPSYLAASYVANSRVEAREHRWRDVVAGAATGILTTRYLTDSAGGPRLGASFAPRSIYLSLQQSFK